ncbi:MAG: hypothetical protein ACR2M4_03200 [Actinomycetota bacterium]
MAKHKAFSFSSNGQEPITFDLAGEKFTCIPEAPGGTLTDFIGDAGEGTSRAAPAMLNFIKAVLIDDDVERFNSIIYSKTIMVPLETLLELVRWLVEQYVDRPTMRPSQSQRGPSATEPTLTGAAPATASS